MGSGDEINCIVLRQDILTQKLKIAFQGRRMANNVPLHVIDAEAFQVTQYLLGFNAFSDGLLTQEMGDLIHGAHHGAIQVVFRNILDVRAVDLEVIRG